MFTGWVPGNKVIRWFVARGGWRPIEEVKMSDYVVRSGSISSGVREATPRDERACIIEATREPKFVLEEAGEGWASMVRKLTNL